MSPPSSKSTIGLAGSPPPPSLPKINSKTSNNVDEEPASNTTNALAPELERNVHSQPPTPPQSHHEQDNQVNEDDYSDALSTDFQQQQQQQRRYPRGGRKPKQPKRLARRLQSVSEFELPALRNEAQPQEEEQDDFDAEKKEEAPTSPLLAAPEAENHEDDYDADADALKKARSLRSKETRKQHSQPLSRNRSTGISSFSLEGPRGGRGKPPIGVSVERPGKKSKVKSKSTGGKKEREREAEEESHGQGSEVGESEEGEREEKEEKRNPVQIRLDLNLELEIVLMAKIKGDITITFL
jgi:hypothetical protein